jgi:peroxiredoxin
MNWLRKVFGGRTMSALQVGTSAPDFTLPAMDGSKFSLREALSRGPVLLAFFKISCPVCQYAMPFVERLYRKYGSKGVTIVGISQNEKKDTAQFIKEYGLTFPILLDDISTYPVSNAYGLTNVPTIFWVAQDGDIEVSSVGWVKKEFEEISRLAAGATSSDLQPVFARGEEIADFRAG